MLVVFSAIHMALNCGNQVFISAGASVPGVSWNTIFTPSITISCPSLAIVSVGGSRVTVPGAPRMPRPPASRPCGWIGSEAPPI
ncbi:hypothetical protein D3C81_1386980 [compost metagenome]